MSNLRDDDSPVLSYNFDADPSQARMEIRKWRDLSEDEKRRFEAALSNPRLMALQQRMREIGLRGSPDVALVEGPLPEGALAHVIVDPTAENPRLIVVSEAGLDDEVLDRASAELTRWELSRRYEGKAARLTVWADGRVRAEMNGRTKTIRPRTEFRYGSDRRMVTREVLDRAKGAVKKEHPGVGRARIVKLHSRSK